MSAIEFVENYDFSKNEYKVVAVGKPPVQPAPPPVKPPPAEAPVKAAGEDGVKIYVNDYGRRFTPSYRTGEVVAIKYKGKFYLATSDEGGKLIYIS